MKLWIVLVPIVALALGCAMTSPAPQEPPAVPPLTLAADEWRAIDRLIVITDASGSMSSAGTFPEAKEITQNLISALPDANIRGRAPGPYQAGSIAFGGDDRIVSPLATFDRGALASAAGQMKLLGGSDPLTPLDAVVDEAREALLGQPGGAALIIISDGKPQSPNTALEAAQDLVASVPDGVCIHAVHTGDDAKGRKLLARLTGLTECGSVLEAASLDSPAAYTEFTRAVFVSSPPGRWMP